MFKNVLCGGHHGLDVQARAELKILLELKIRGVRDGYGETVVLAMDRQSAVLAGKPLRHCGQGIGIDRGAPQVHPAQA